MVTFQQCIPRETGVDEVRAGLGLGLEQERPAVALGSGRNTMSSTGATGGSETDAVDDRKVSQRMCLVTQVTNGPLSNGFLVGFR